MAGATMTDRDCNLPPGRRGARPIKQRFQELAKLQRDGQNHVCMDKAEIQRVGFS